MKKYYITKYIAIAATIDAPDAHVAVERFEDAITGIYIDGKADDKGMSFGDSGEPATVEEVVPATRLNLVGTIAGGEFLAHPRA